LAVHSTQTPRAVSQIGLEPPPHIMFDVHRGAQVLSGVQTPLFGQLALVTHSTHSFVGLQCGVAIGQFESERHVTHLIVDVLQ
jgi:hypothetical protein